MDYDFEYFEVFTIPGVVGDLSMKFIYHLESAMQSMYHLLLPIGKIGFRSDRSGFHEPKCNGNRTLMFCFSKRKLLEGVHLKKLKINPTIGTRSDLNKKIWNYDEWQKTAQGIAVKGLKESGLEEISVRKTGFETLTKMREQLKVAQRVFLENHGTDEEVSYTSASNLDLKFKAPPVFVQSQLQTKSKSKSKSEMKAPPVFVQSHTKSKSKPKTKSSKKSLVPGQTLLCFEPSAVPVFAKETMPALLPRKRKANVDENWEEASDRKPAALLRKRKTCVDWSHKGWSLR